MAAPVWLLSVDLQAKTATFTTGLSDAAKSARGSFNEIKEGATEAGAETGYSMMEARHSVMMLGEEFGIRLPRALSSFIAGLGPLGPALEAAFPFLAIAGLATILIEHLVKMHEAGEKLTADQINFGTAAQNAFNALDDKLIQAKIRADELRNDHLGALKLQLELIDHQSMSELVHSFEQLGKDADEVMKGLESHWYTFGIGSDGANHALKEFGLEYRALAAAGDEKAASGLLHGTLEQAKKILAFQKEGRDNSGDLSGPKEGADISKVWEAKNALKATGVGWTEKEVQAQEQLVATLTKQVGIEDLVANVKKQDYADTKKATSNKGEAQASAAARQAAESMTRLGQQSISAEKATTDAQLTIHRASLEARLAADMDFAGRERDTQLAGNQAQIAALDKSGSDYSNQLKGLKEKALEIQSEYDTKTAQLSAKAAIEENTRDLTALQQSEREKIDGTREGTNARLAAINEGIQREQAAGLQDTNFFRDLRTARVKLLTQMAEEEAKLQAEAGKESADAGEKSGLLTLAAEKQNQQLLDSSRHMSNEQRVIEEQKFATDEFNIKLKWLQQEEAALDKSGKDYNNKLKQIQNQEKQLTQQHANEIAAIKIKAEEESNARILSAEQRAASQTADGLSRSIMGHETWARMITSLGDQAVAGLIRNSLMVMMQQDKERLSDARKAASSAYATGEKIGGPAGLILGPTFAAAAFAGVMAFNSGTDAVPGVGNTDSVAARLTPGEGVVPGGVMDGLRTMARNGGFNGNGTTNHLHYHPTFHVNTLDGDGMQDALEKNSHVVTKHIESTLRRMNK